MSIKPACVFSTYLYISTIKLALSAYIPHFPTYTKAILNGYILLVFLLCLPKHMLINEHSLLGFLLCQPIHRHYKIIIACLCLLCLRIHKFYKLFKVRFCLSLLCLSITIRKYYKMSIACICSCFSNIYRITIKWAQPDCVSALPTFSQAL